MERKLATIEVINNIRPIPGADAIEVGTVRGWNVVIAKDSFKNGDMCIYCEIDSVMPDRPEFEFLASKKYRIKTIRLRKQVSQGIVFNLDILESVGDILNPTIGNEEYDVVLSYTNKDTNELHAIPIVEGEDVTDILGVTKYDPPIPACLEGISKGNFPSHSIKTDEERIQNLMEMYEEYKKEIWVETEKLDGSSATYSIFNDIFEVSSRNTNLIESEGNSFWKVARELKIEERMRAYMEDHNMEYLTLQGELIGEGIQGNKYKLNGQTVKFFRGFDPGHFEFIEFLTFISMIKEMGLETVPIPNTSFTLPDNFEDLIIHVDGPSELYKTAREGSVFVNIRAKGNNSRESFKVISNKFILKHDA